MGMKIFKHLYILQPHRAASAAQPLARMARLLTEVELTRKSLRMHEVGFLQGMLPLMPVNCRLTINVGGAYLALKISGRRLCNQTASRISNRVEISPAGQMRASTPQ